MTIDEETIKSIVTKVLTSQDYRMDVVNIINAEFLRYAIVFFGKVAEAKLKSQNISIDWYKDAFINDDQTADDIAIFAGLNKKTIHNMYHSSTKNIVLNASREHFELLHETVKSLMDVSDDTDLTLTIKFRGVSVDLNVDESLIVINALAVKRAALRGGLWSSAGKRVEKVLMLALCRLYKVDALNYNANMFSCNKQLAFDRETDFYLINGTKQYKCEVKLMGQGNPESADAIIARDTQLFVAETLSQQNKNQCDSLGVKWISCRDYEGYKRFETILESFEIPFTPYNGKIGKDLPVILDSILNVPETFVQ